MHRLLAPLRAEVAPVPRPVLRLIALVAAVLFLARLISGCPENGPQLSPNVRLETGIVYGQGYVADATAPSGYVLLDLHFDMLMPRDRPEPGKPGVLLAHGGGFEGGSRKDDELVIFADQLASQGYVCFLMDYRLVRHQPPAPPPFHEDPRERAAHAAIVDAKAALRHIRANSARYGVHPQRLAIFGQSAGAIVAMGAGMTSDRSFDSDGPDFPVPPGNHPQESASVAAVVEFWGSATEILPYFEPKDPPIMIVHGTEDRHPDTPFSAARAIVETCEAQGIPYVFYPLEGHGHAAWRARVEGRSLSELTMEFLESQLIVDS